MRKRTGAAKKKKRQAEIQKTIRERERDLAEAPCNVSMVCDRCGSRQKNRAFCYFCHSVQRLPRCAECSRQKCFGGDCLVKHGSKTVSGLNFVGAICDWCEVFVCHSRKCIKQHGCPGCPLDGAVCKECNRAVDSCGSRFFKCASCDEWLCGECQFEHQASCTVLDSENYQCVSCNRFGTWSCLKCKVCYCSEHYKSKLSKPGDAPSCKKCRTPLRVTKDMSVSARSHEYGRHSSAKDESERYSYLSEMNKHKKQSSSSSSSNALFSGIRAWFSPALPPGVLQRFSSSGGELVWLSDLGPPQTTNSGGSERRDPALRAAVAKVIGAADLFFSDNAADELSQMFATGVAEHEARGVTLVKSQWVEDSIEHGVKLALAVYLLPPAGFFPNAVGVFYQQLLTRGSTTSSLRDARLEKKQRRTVASQQRKVQSELEKKQRVLEDKLKSKPKADMFLGHQLALQDTVSIESLLPYAEPDFLVLIESEDEAGDGDETMVS
eukprot:TRINITY_DN65549_c9_g11_i1.p2 TRINITY_DN65549_c9_g11~~TRINITY_DN65549_c9_g11_i1.p2  ORF type:complete len:494 (-),score=238.44 TRINITY_DN65549_c9_g11_i1:92-1573(-)